MECIIFVTTIHDFLKEIENDPTAYVQTMRRQKEKDIKEFVCVLSGFNASNRAVQFGFVVDRVQGSKNIQNAVSNAMRKTKERAETVEKDLRAKGVTVHYGIVSGVSSPIYGTYGE